MSGVESKRHYDLATFAELTMPLLRADPVRHNGAISVLVSRLNGTAPNGLTDMVTVHAGGVLCGATLRALRWPLIASALPTDAAPAVAELLAERDEPPPEGEPLSEPLPGVTGPRENAEAFAEQWCRRTGQTARVEMALRLFRLGELRPPAAVPGTARMAGAGDIELLVRWRSDFAAAALPAGTSRPDDPRTVVERQLAAGQGNVLWEVNGEPVSLAVASTPVAGMSRIGPVWTPPEHRVRGYGSAATAAASRWALDAGVEHVVLFTDLSNPVSNRIYQRLGYRPVHDVVDLAFERP